jgi:hypothetical protein
MASCIIPGVPAAKIASNDQISLVLNTLMSAGWHWFKSHRPFGGKRLISW